MAIRCLALNKERRIKMVTEYQAKIMKMSGVEFESIDDSDILTWDYTPENSGVRSWYNLYDANGHLKDIQIGKAIPVSERLFLRPPMKNSAEMIEADNHREEIRENKIAIAKEKAAKKAQKKLRRSLTTQGSQGTIVSGKKPKIRRNLSPEERERRAIRMAEVAKKYWASKRKQENVEDRGNPQASVSN